MYTHKGNTKFGKRLSTYLTYHTIKLQEILDAVKAAIQKTNPDYDLVIKRLHLYYDMKLVTFSIDKDRDLIIQFSVFIQPHTQQYCIR